MKLSDNTLTILKNFAGINNSILVKQGNKLRTISVAKNILAEANITEEFPRDFAIYDLNQFLNGLGLHQDPDLDFTEDSYLSIKEGKRRVKYFFADPNVIISPPDKDIQLPSSDVCFQLDSTSLEKLVKSGALSTTNAKTDSIKKDTGKVLNPLTGKLVSLAYYNKCVLTY